MLILLRIVLILLHGHQTVTVVEVVVLGGDVSVVVVVGVFGLGGKHCGVIFRLL